MSNIIRTMFSLCAIEGLQTHSRVFALRSPCRSRSSSRFGRRLTVALAVRGQSNTSTAALRLEGAHQLAAECLAIYV